MPVYRVSNLPDNADKFVFDTNILIFLHGLLHRPSQEMREYTKIANAIICDNSQVLIDLIALEEFINRYIHESLAQKFQTAPRDFKFNKKEHRKTKEYLDVLSDLNMILHQIWKSYNIQLITDGYDKFDIDKVTEILPTMELNDYLISLAAKKYNAYLVTHDRDIVESCPDLNILTALPDNRRH